MALQRKHGCSAVQTTLHKPLEWWAPSCSVLENTVINPAENLNINIMTDLDQHDVFLLQYILSVIRPRYSWGDALGSFYNPRKRKKRGKAPNKLQYNTGNPIKNKKAQRQWWLHHGFSWLAFAMETAGKKAREEKPHCLPELLQPGSAASSSAWCTVTQPSSCEKNQKLIFQRISEELDIRKKIVYPWLIMHWHSFVRNFWCWRLKAG